MAIEGILGRHGVPGVNEIEEKLVEERGIVIGNTWFVRRYIRKYRPT